MPRAPKTKNRSSEGTLVEPVVLPKDGIVPPTPMAYTDLLSMAWQGKLDFAQLLHHMESSLPQSQPGLLPMLYYAWLQRTPIGIHHAFAWFNLGVLLFAEGDMVGAEKAYQKALSIKPDLVHARFNLGMVCEKKGLLDEAIAQWQQVQVDANPEHPQQRPILITALNNQARVQEQRKQFADAMAALNRSLELDPNQPDVMHHWVFIKAKQCEWPVYDPPKGVSVEQLRENTSALALLSLSDDPQSQLDAAVRYVQRKIPENLPRLAPTQGYQGHQKIRIAYCSSDFCLHPVSMLTVELIELHDREKFEVYGFCWSPNDGSALRQRVVKAFDHYIPIGHLDEEASAQLIRDHEIDILIDLQGQTAGARMRMLSLRPAPIQITYLGLPATTGMPCIDYVIADRFLIPEEYANFYSEKPLYLPDVYQSSDRKRLSAPVPKRKDCGLPARSFVFCSFNNNYKYTPEVFKVWMNVLHRVPGSVLWLLADNPWAQANLQREAKAHGIDPKRLVFAERVLPDQYLARYAIADLFLDTFPFNAGTTANDALWMGLPLLTLSGRTFASRMAGALLTAAGIPELITYDLQAYEELAVQLASDKKLLKSLRKKLAVAKEGSPLFNSENFTRNLEQEYKGLVENLLENSINNLNSSTSAKKENPLRLSQLISAERNSAQVRPNKITTLVQEAEVYQAQGDINAAINIYQRWLKKYHNNQNKWVVEFNLGVLLRDVGDVVEAKKYLQAVLQKKPHFMLAQLALKQINKK